MHKIGRMQAICFNIASTKVYALKLFVPVQIQAFLQKYIGIVYCLMRHIFSSLYLTLYKFKCMTTLTVPTNFVFLWAKVNYNIMH